MSSRIEKERFKNTQEKSQAILSALLKDEDNKYCVDCDAKGPRWASWNLGIFLCIRCAGIHRNLGVHISRVKSVNLDTWTPEQISMMMEIGNSRARAVYEANIPDNFRRPQIDSPLESFIRAKYEHKKYIAREWIPPTPKVPKEFMEDDTKDKKRTKPKAGMIQLNAAPKSKSSSSASNGSVRKSPETSKPSQPEPITSAQPKESSAALDLLGLDTPTPNTSNSDLLGDLLGGPQPVQPSVSNNTAPAQQTTPTGQTTPDQPQQTTNGTPSLEESLMSETSSKSTKESILALYGSGNSQQQQFGVPGGVYMPQQGGQQQMGMYGGVPMMGHQPNMMGQQPNMMGQQHNMMGQQPNMMGQQPNMMGQQPNMMGQQPNMMGQQPNMMGQQPNMMGQQPNMMGQHQGMMGQPQGMMAMQPTPEQLYMYHQQMSGQYYEYLPYEQQPNMYHGMGMMGGGGGGGAMMMQPGATPNQMGNNMAMYNQPQMQQYQQMQQQMSSMKLGNSTGLSMGGQSNWGAPSTLSNNLWQ